jgi:excisionase family DNA binding protein
MTYEELKNYPGVVVTIKDVASLLQVDTKTVSRAIKENLIPIFPMGGRKRLILKQPLLNLLEAGFTVGDSVA